MRFNLAEHYRKLHLKRTQYVTGSGHAVLCPNCERGEVNAIGSFSGAAREQMNESERWAVSAAMRSLNALCWGNQLQAHRDHNHGEAAMKNVPVILHAVADASHRPRNPQDRLRL
jgi:hypothetical protein